MDSIVLDIHEPYLRHLVPGVQWDLHVAIKPK